MKKLIYITMLIMVLFNVSNVQAKPQEQTTNTYYVDPFGVDTNLGTESSPFKTIQKCANVAPIGGTCIVKYGLYNETITVTRPGITFEGQGKPVVKQFFVSSTATNPTIRGFYVKDNPKNSGGISVDSSGATIENNTIDRSCMAGIIVRADNYVIRGNEIFGSLQCPNGGGSGFDADGMRPLGSHGLVEGNYIHGIVKTADINATAHSDGIQADYGSFRFEDVIIRNNTILGMVDAGIQTDGNFCNGVDILNNIIQASRPLNMECANVDIIGNTFLGLKVVAGGSFFVSLRAGSSNATFQKNIVCNTSDGFLTQLGIVVAGGNSAINANIFWNVWGTAPRRDSGYNYTSSGGALKWPFDKWQTFDPGVCGSIVPTPTPTTPTVVPPTATKTVTPSPTATRTPTVTPSLTRTPTATPSATPTTTMTPRPTSTDTLTPSPTPATPYWTCEVSETEIRCLLVQ